MKKKSGDAGYAPEASPRGDAQRSKIMRMLDRHLRRSIWLKARAPLVFALVEIALAEDSADNVRLRAIEKIEELLEKAEDEKRYEAFGGMEEGIEATLRRLEAAIRRGKRNSALHGED